MYQKEVLDNGVRIVAERISSMKSASIGIWVDVGSRDEGTQEEGNSHFIEHMFFKGTKKRTAKDIAQEIDSIGGELNAFTSRETTTFYAKVLDEHLPAAVDLLSDIFHYSLFDKKEIEKEKQVVLEEIKMVEDDPEDLVQDLHTQYVWRGHPLGRPILGRVETIEALTREKIVGYRSRFYQPHAVVIAVAGSFKMNQLFTLLSTTFGGWRGNGVAVRHRATPQTHGGIQVKKKRLEQLHLCLGTHGLPQGHPDRFGIFALHTLLGGSVSSRLFQEIRENRGLAYSIYSFPSFYKDVGLFSVYAATSAKSALTVIRLIIEELGKLKEKGISPSELEMVKNHIKGSLMLSMESTSSRMSRLAKDELSLGRYFSLGEVLAEVDKVSSSQIKRLARDLFHPQFLTLTALGPLTQKILPDLLDRLA